MKRSTAIRWSARCGGAGWARPARSGGRGGGLVAAVECVAGPGKRFDPVGSVAARVTRECLERGVITRALPEGDSIAFSPPFVITEAEIDEVVRVAREAADIVAGEVL